MIGTSTDQQGAKAVLWLLFSPNGRVSRRWYWYTQLVMLPFQSIVYLSEDPVWLLIAFAGLLLILVPGLMISIKRWHDLGKSGWWVFINAVPMIGPIYALWQQGFGEGTPGSNSYGPDPLDESSGPVVSNTERALPRQRGTGTGTVTVPAAYRTDKVPADR